MTKNFDHTSKLRLVDTHCHIDFKEFDSDRDLIIAQAQAAGVLDIIVPAVAQGSWNKTITICQRYSQCHLALGLHPVFIDQHQPQHLIELDTLLKTTPTIAVGEIGLDFFLKELDREKQKIFFSKQLIIAKKHKLPVIIHNRKAHDECILMLNETGANSGIIHAFNGSIQQAEKYIELGFLLGFGGMLTYQRSNKLKALVKQLPIESIVLETDAPDMTVQQHHGKRNSPHYLPYVLDSIVEVKKIDINEVATICSNNARQLFSKFKY